MQKVNAVNQKTGMISKKYEKSFVFWLQNGKKIKGKVLQNKKHLL